MFLLLLATFSLGVLLDLLLTLDCGFAMIVPPSISAGSIEKILTLPLVDELKIGSELGKKMLAQTTISVWECKQNMKAADNVSGRICDDLRASEAIHRRQESLRLFA